MKKFDVIIGNPPYQDSDLPQNNALWPRFVNLSFSLLSSDGYLGFVTPLSWLNPSGEEAKRNIAYNPGAIRRTIFGNNSLVYCSVRKTIGEYFNVGSSFSTWIVKNDGQSKPAIILTDDGQITADLSKIPFLPAKLSNITQSIVTKFFWSGHPLLPVTNLKGEGFHSSHSKRVTKIKTKGFDWPLADTSAKYLIGIYLWSSEKHPYQDSKKVIISESGYLGPMFDNGHLGTTEHSFVILVDTTKEGKNLVSVLNSRLYRLIMNICRWGSANHKYIIKNLPSVDLTRTWTDAELYKHFNLTQEEIDYIEANVK